jgi:hypothetical protein
MLAAACTDHPTQTRGTDPDPAPEPAPEPPKVLGVYEFTLTGFNGGEAGAQLSSVSPVSGGPSNALTTVNTGLTYELISTSSFVEGTRGQGGHRYLMYTYRVRNTTGAPVSNLTLVPVTRATTIAGTPFSSLLKFDGTAASTTIAAQIVPTGAAVQNTEGALQSPFPDVLQVFQESEVAAIAPPAGVTGIFPYGFVVRVPGSANSRTLANAADVNDFGGILTFAFRYPLQATAAADPFTINFQAVAVSDTETRVTESIEEGQDTAAVRRLRERATALGATTTTVLNGSTAAAPDVADYPGQRQICSPRTAGPSGAPTTTIVNAAAYVQLFVLRPGESVNSCSAYFLGGTPARPATNVPYTVTLTAMDRYGNMRTAVADSVRVVQQSGPTITIGAGGLLVSGQRAVTVTFNDYGTSVLGGVGRRMNGWQTIPVMGVTRTWTAGAGTTDWHTNGNWSPAAVPMSLDSVTVPLVAPVDPVLAANVSVQGVTVEDGATISLNAFDLTASGNVFAGLTGGITNTTGRLVLAGTARTVQGRLPRLRVTGTYSLTGNVTARAPLQVESGRLTNAAFRVQMESF